LQFSPKSSELGWGKISSPLAPRARRRPSLPPFLSRMAPNDPASDPVGLSGAPSGSTNVPPSMTPHIPGVEGMTEDEIAAFLESLDEFTPTIPDGLTNHYLKRSGIKEPDVRITRLISLAAQKFVTQIALDARQCAQQRSEMMARERRDRGYDAKEKRAVLTMEDVSAALGEYGVNVKKPPYFQGGAVDPGSVNETQRRSK